MRKPDSATHRTLRMRIGKPMRPMHAYRLLPFSVSLLAAFVLRASVQEQTPHQDPPRPGGATPGVRRLMADVHPLATFAVEGEPDWMVVTEDAVWVTSSNVNHVVRLDPATNRPGLIVTIDKPCSGLAAGFGSIWVPSCGAHNLVRVDPQTGKIKTKL